MAGILQYKQVIDNLIVVGQKGPLHFSLVWTRQLVLLGLVLAENFYEIFNFVINYIFYAQLKLKLILVKGDTVKSGSSFPVVESQSCYTWLRKVFQCAGRLVKLNSLMWFKKETLSISGSNFSPCNFVP